MSKERRDSYRLDVPEGHVRLHAAHVPDAVRVSDLSASGGGLIVPAEEAPGLARSPVVLYPGEYDPFRTRVVPVRTLEDAGLARVGVRFESLDRKALESLSLFLIDRFREESRQVGRLLAAAGLSMASFRRDMVLRLLLRYAIHLGRPLRVYSGTAQVPMRLRARSLAVEAARQVILAEILTGAAGMLRAGEEFVFTFTGSNAVNHFTSAVWRTASREVAVCVPAEIRQVGFRDSPRIRPVNPVGVAFDHPRLRGLRLVKDVVDVSGRGLSFTLDPRNDVLFPGERLGRICLDTPHGQVRAEAAIRSIVPQPHEELAAGAEILGFPDAGEAERWKRFVFHEGHPRLELGYGSLVEQAWETLRSSGYVELLDEAERSYMERKFLDAWKDHPGASRTSRFFLFKKDGKSVGTAAASLLYPHTWMAHHFGIDLEEREDRTNLFDIAREIYSGTMFLLQHMAPLDCFVFYFDAAKPWHDLFFGQFIQRYSDKQDLIFDGFRLYKRLMENDVPPLDAGEIEVVADDPHMLRLLSGHLETTLAPLEYEAFCFDEAGISLSAFSRDCEKTGYERTRKVFFALQGREPLAALVAETGREGVNVFSLLNRCWFVWLDPCMRSSEAVEECLINAAIGHFTTAGKRTFLLLGDPAGEPTETMERLGFSYVADGRRWLARREVIPAYLSYMEDVISSIDPD